VVIGGLVTATLLTLVVLPALYARFGSADAGSPGGRARRQAGAPPETVARGRLLAPDPTPAE
jgi:cobalt-zinc-cadmium resistance protein CzcA